MTRESEGLTALPPQLTVVRYADPHAEQFGHRPGSAYVELVWLGVLGPSTTLAWQRLARQAASTDRFTVDLADLSLSLGLGESYGPRSTLARTMLRLVMFDAARLQDDWLAVRVSLPDVLPRQLPRLSASAQRAHACLSHVAQNIRPSSSSHSATARIST